MKTFTGTFIWVPLYASLMYLLLKNFHWKEVVCYTVAIALAITLSDQLCSSLIRPEVARLRPGQPEQSDCGPGAYRQWLPGRQIRLPLLPCSQLVCVAGLCAVHFPQPPAHPLLSGMGRCQLLHPPVFRRALSGRFAAWEPSSEADWERFAARLAAKQPSTGNPKPPIEEPSVTQPYPSASD